jgi:hypothetical protein
MDGREGCVESMVEMVNMAWGREIHLDLNLNEHPTEENDVDD